MREVRPRIVIGDDVLSLERQHGRAPLLELRVDGRFELFVVRVIGRGVRRIHRAERLRDVLRDGLGDDRVDDKMGIAEGVDVASGAGRAGGHVHQAHALRSLDAAGLADFDLRVARVLQQRRQPPDLEFGAAVDQDISVAQLDDETRTRIDEVGVFGRFGEDAYVHFVPADFASERTEIGKGGDDFQFGLAREGEAENCGQD